MGKYGSEFKYKNYLGSGAKHGHNFGRGAGYVMMKTPTEKLYFALIVLTLAILSFLVYMSQAGTLPRTSSNQLLVAYRNSPTHIAPAYGEYMPEFMLLADGTVVYKDPCTSCLTRNFKLMTAKLSPNEVNVLISGLTKAGISKLKSPQDGGGDGFIYFDYGGVFKITLSSPFAAQSDFKTVADLLTKYTHKNAKAYVPKKFLLTIRGIKSDPKLKVAKPLSSFLPNLSGFVKSGSVSKFVSGSFASAISKLMNGEGVRVVKIEGRFYRVEAAEEMPQFVMKKSGVRAKLNNRFKLFPDALADSPRKVRPIAFVANKDLNLSEQERQQTITATDGSANRVRNFYFREDGKGFAKAGAEFVRGTHEANWYHTNCPGTDCSDVDKWSRFGGNVIADFKSISARYRDEEQKWVIYIFGNAPSANCTEEGCAVGAAKTGESYAVVFVNMAHDYAEATGVASTAQVTDKAAAHELGHIFGFEHPLGVDRLNPNNVLCKLEGELLPDEGDMSIMGYGSNDFPNLYTCDVHHQSVRSPGGNTTVFSQPGSTEDNTKPPLPANVETVGDVCGVTITWRGVADNSRVRRFIINEQRSDGSRAGLRREPGKDWIRRSNPAAFTYSFRKSFSRTQARDRDYTMRILSWDAGLEASNDVVVTTRIPGSPTPIDCDLDDLTQQIQIPENL